MFDHILDPTGQSQRSAVQERAVARRLPTLAGARVGLLDNTKKNAIPLLAELGRLLEREHGAVVTFHGIVRDYNQGRRVTHLVYEAYEPLAVKTLARIVDEAQERLRGVRLAIHHRTGRMEIGDASVIIAALTRTGSRLRRRPPAARSPGP